MDQVISPQFWTRLVSIQYTMYSRLTGGAKIAGNGILLLQLRFMFMAYMMSCNPGTKGLKVQTVAKAWLGIFSRKGKLTQVRKINHLIGTLCLKNVSLSFGCRGNGSCHCGNVGLGAMVDGLSCLYCSRITSRGQRFETKTL